MWRVLGEPEQITLVELGPGRGLFAQDMLAWSKKMFPAFYSAVRYALMEGSAGLRSRLAELFAAEIGAGKVRITSTLDETAFNTPFIPSVTSSSMRCLSRCSTIAASCA